MSRRWRVLILVSLLCGLSVTSHAQVLPPAGARQTIQEDVEARALAMAKDLELRLYGTMVGNLNQDVMATIRRWDKALQGWRRDDRSGAAPWLAEGVLFDCLSRMPGVRTEVLTLEENRPFFLDVAEARPGRAVSALREALKRDPAMAEARFRLARLRSTSDSEAAREL